MPRPILALLAWLGMLSCAAAQNDPAPLTPPGYDDPLDAPAPNQTAKSQPAPGQPPSAQPQPLPHYHALPPQPVALPPTAGTWQYVPPAPTPAVAPLPALPVPRDAQAQHLLKAAEHLEAAGLTEQAAKLRQQARQRSLAPQLAAKLAQLKTLQAEIQRLKQAAGGERQVTLQVKIAETSRANVKDWLARYAAKSTLPIVVENNEFPGAPDDFWASLEESRELSVLSRPHLASVSGQTAKVIVGRTAPTVIPAGQDQTALAEGALGVSFEVTPHVLADDQLRLELQCRTGKLDPSRDRKIGRQTVPGVRVCNIEASLEMKVGQTAILACLEEERRPDGVRQTSATSTKEDEVTLVFVTPTAIGERTERAVPPHPVAEKPHPAQRDR